MSKTWKIVFLALLAIGIVLLGYHLRAIFVPLLVALILAYMLNPLVTGLERKGVPRLASIAAIYALLIGVVATVVLWIVPMGFREAKEFVQVTFTDKDAKINRVVDWAAVHLQEWLHVKSKEEVLATIREKMKGHESQLAGYAGRVATAVLGFGTGSIGFFLTLFSFIALVPVYLFFLLKNMNRWWDRFTHWLPRAYRDQTLATLGRIHRAVASFFRGQITISLLEGFIIFIGLKLIGVKFSFLFGLMYAVLSVFPYIGVAVGFTIVELFVFADTGAFGRDFFLVAGLFGLIQVLEGVVLQPMILGKETGLHPIVIILGLLICGELFGFFGMLIAVPLTSAIKILLDDYVWPAYEEVADLTKVRPKPEVPTEVRPQS